MEGPRRRIMDVLPPPLPGTLPSHPPSSLAAPTRRSRSHPTVAITCLRWIRPGRIRDLRLSSPLMATPAHDRPLLSPLPPLSTALAHRGPRPPTARLSPLTVDQ
uniref:Uncharacterized protein n=1 Tax=Oryza nivara TaxID=4536 RepID=A0A0E0GY27_ORYNI